MSELSLNMLAASNAKFLAVRQSLVARNIANANSPGYQALDVKPLSEQSVDFSSLVRTHELHFANSSNEAGGLEVVKDDTYEFFQSGGNVSLPKEMIKAGEIASAYKLNTSVMKSFHRMVISVFGS